MRKQQVRKFICRIWKEWRNTIFFIVFVLIPVKSSLADWNWVPTGSMNPTILQGDLIYVDKLAYDTHAVMSTPSIRAMRNFGPITVPPDNYFVMGDNRDSSKDSRHFGFVQRKAIVGKARGVILSFDITDKYQPRLKRGFASLK